MKHKILYILLCVISFNTHGQYKNIEYLDTDKQRINFEEFSKKKNLEGIKVKLYVADNGNNILYKKLTFTKCFGTLNPTEKEQLNKYFYSRYQIDTTKTWLIHYVDSLPSPEKMPEKSGIVYTDSTKTKHKHLYSFKDYHSSFKTEKKRFKKYKECSLLHFYINDNDYPMDIDNIHWCKDEHRMLKSLFFKEIDYYSTIIIHPNGEYYLSKYSHRSEDRLLRFKIFRKEKERWDKKFLKKERGTT